MVYLWKTYNSASVVRQACQEGGVLHHPNWHIFCTHFLTYVYFGLDALINQANCKYLCFFVVSMPQSSKEDGLSTCKTSRINLVDLAGSEQQKLTSAAGLRLKQTGNISRSLSQLG